MQVANTTHSSASTLSSNIIELYGHIGPVLACRYSPDGSLLATASSDRKIFIWNALNDCSNIFTLSGHHNAVVDICWSQHSDKLVSASSDRDLILWDIHERCRLRTFRGHTGIANSCSSTRKGPEIFASAGDDGSVRLWDQRSKESIFVIETDFPILSVEFSLDGLSMYSSGIDPAINVWDLRLHGLRERWEGHGNTVTGLRMNNQGSFLLSNSMDNVLRAWDVRPYLDNPSTRESKIFKGHSHGFEQNLLRCAWSSNGELVAAGSADRFLYIWDFETTEIMYKLPGHKGSVNDVAFHPDVNIVVSAGNDKKLFVGKLE